MAKTIKASQTETLSLLNCLLILCDIKSLAELEFYILAFVMWFSKQYFLYFIITQ